MHLVRIIRLAFVLLSSVWISVRAADKAAYTAHVNALKNFPCGDPQPKVFELEDVISKDFLEEKTHGYRQWVKPAVTVLHRCESTGCCEIPNQRCMPSGTQDVTLTFGVFSGSTKEYFDVAEVNHTQCACVPI